MVANASLAFRSLMFNGIAVRDRGEMLSLTDLWRAAGSDPARKPSEWLRSADAQRFIEFLGETVGISHLLQTATGRGGATYAHWQIALAYAKYLSPEFHAACNVVIRERSRPEGRTRGASGRLGVLVVEVDGPALVEVHVDGFGSGGVGEVLQKGLQCSRIARRCVGHTVVAVVRKCMVQATTCSFVACDERCGVERLRIVGQ